MNTRRSVASNAHTDDDLEMGGENSKSRAVKDTLPSIKLPASASYYDGMYKQCDTPEISRGRTGSASSRSSQPRHPVPAKMRKLIQGCFLNPHELVGKRIMKRACESKMEFLQFYIQLDPELREDMEESIKVLLKKVVANINFPDEIQRHSEDFGRQFIDLRPLGFKPDFFPTIADATIKECMQLDSAVHRAHHMTEAFSQLGTMIFSSVRDGFYLEIRRNRRASNTFSTGSGGSQRRKKRSIDSESLKGSRGNSPRTSFSRGGSPRSASPESHISDEIFVDVIDDGYLKPPSMAMVSARTY